MTLSSTKPTRPGYEFTGWKATDGILYTSGGKYTKNEGTILSAQWKVLRTLPSFTYTGSFELVKDDNTIIASGTNKKVVIPENYQSYSGNWKIRFLTSGTLTLHELGNASIGIDVFLVGGGGGGGGNSSGACSGGGGGGGGYRVTVRNVAVTQTSYYIKVGAGGKAGGYSAANSGGSSEAFGLIANGGMPGSKASKTGAGVGGAGGANGGNGGNGKTGGGKNGGNGGYEFDEAVYGTLYGGGGGGGAGNYSSSRGYGGSGGGGKGGKGNNYGEDNGSPGVKNTGGGGGGHGGDADCSSTNADDENGGSGIVIIRNARK